MKPLIVADAEMILLVGGGPIAESSLESMILKADAVVAADSGADWLLGLGHQPDVVIGDLDSISPTSLEQIPSDRLHRITEQDSTDFEKCLRLCKARVTLAFGFLGGRVDHELAVLSVLSRYVDRVCLAIGEEDVILHVPPKLSLELPLKSRVSLFPMAPVTGRSEGVRWPINGLNFAPNAQIGTSNEVNGPVHLEMDGPGMLLILPRSALQAVLEALDPLPAGWPAL